MPLFTMIVMLDLSFSLIELGIWVVFGIVLLIFNHLLQELAAERATESELDAISRGIGSSSTVTFFIACAVLLAIAVILVVCEKLLGVQDPLAQALPVLAQNAIWMSLVALSLYIGWRLKGRSVFHKHTSQVGIAFS